MSRSSHTQYNACMEYSLATDAGGGMEADSYVYRIRLFDPADLFAPPPPGLEVRDEQRRVSRKKAISRNLVVVLLFDTSPH
jgi:hypothetical protein